MASLFEKTLLKWEFVKYIPPRQILRRVFLAAKKLYVIKNANTTSDIEFASAGWIVRKSWHLLNLEAPHGTLTQSDQGWRANFLNIQRNLGRDIDWSCNTDDARWQLWRMNLHYFEFLPDVQSQQGFFLILDWIRRCRPSEKQATDTSWNSYTISLRISAWINFYSLHQSESSIEFQNSFAASLSEQAAYLVDNLETDILGNHIIKNIRALHEAAYAFSHSGKTNKWTTVADKWLKKQLDVQILPDGVHYELSPSYHVQVFADLLAVYAIRKPDEFTSVLKLKLEAMSQAIIDLRHPDGSLAQFNDSGIDMAIAPVKALHAYENLVGEKPAPRKHFVFQNAGYYGFRSAGLYIAVKMGKLGPDSLMAHAHGDWGTFEMSVNGERIVVDQGVFEYIGGEIRDQSRSTKNHNTAVFNDQEQATFIGSFRCSHRPRPLPVDFSLNQQGFELTGKLTGIRGLAHTTITRTFRVSSNFIAIQDNCNISAKVCASVLFHPGCNIKQHKSATIVTTDKTTLKIKFEDSSQVETTVEPAVWWPNMGYEMSTKRLRANASMGTVHTQIFFDKL